MHQVSPHFITSGLFGSHTPATPRVFKLYPGLRLVGIGVATALWLGASSAWAVEEAITLEHDYVRGPNLLAGNCVTIANQTGNPAFNGAGGWTFSADAGGVTPLYDALVSAASGSGSATFPNTSTAGAIYAKAQSCAVAGTFQYDKPYTISFRFKADATPAYLGATLHYYDASNNFLGYSVEKMGAVSAANTWQEFTGVYRIPNVNTARVRVAIETIQNGPVSRPTIHVDDVYLGEGISFGEDPSLTRRSFDGSKVRVDKWGNWQTYDNQSAVWQDFFPFGLYPDLARDDYESLADLGFNLVMSQQYASQVQKAKEAGIYACLRLSKYSKPGDTYWTLTRLEDTIAEITGGILNDSLLCYDWDNEKTFVNSYYWPTMVSTVQAKDTSRPISILNGYAAVQRAFSSLSDVAGTYVDYNWKPDVGNFEVLQYLQGQKTPASIAQINAIANTADEFRLRVYDALIKGARGIIWWGDSDNHVENLAWSTDVPELRAEIDDLLPLLKQPYGVSWSATSSDTNVLVGRRDLNGEGYLIVANPQGSAAQVTFTLTGITPSEVWNYFDDAFVTLVQNGQFTVQLDARSTAVYRLSANAYPESLENGGLDVAASPLIEDWSGSGTGFSLDSSVKYNGVYAGKIVNTHLSDNRTFLQYFPALKPSTKYRFTAMIKTDNVIKAQPTDNGSGAVVQFFAGGFKNDYLPSGGVSGTQDWQLIEHTFTTPSSFSQTAWNSWYIRLRLYNATGSVWYDNVSLKEVP